MMMFDELREKFERNEITLDEYLSTPTEPGSFTVKDSPKRGRRAGKRQAAMVTTAQQPVAAEIPITSPSHPNTIAEPMPHAYAKDKGGAPDSLQEPDGNRAVMPGNLKTAAAARQFILAGNAYFTVRSLTTGARYTFRVSRGKAKEGYCRWCRQEVCRCVQPHFVSYLSGPENLSDYTYLGWIKDNQFSTTKASARLADSTVFKAFRWVWQHVVVNELPPKTEVWHEGRCGRCGRTLTVPESIEAGIGPECAGKM